MKIITEEINKNYNKCDFNLEKSFNEALQNEKFNEFVSKLKLPHEKLIKYTSHLEESFNNYCCCVGCKGLNECCFKLNGYCYLPKVIDGILEFNYQPCNYKKQEIMKNSHLKNVHLFDVPYEVREANIKNIYNNDSKRHEAILWINKFLGNYKKNNVSKGLYLSGNFGCGKTYLICSLFNELARDNVKSAIVFWPEFLRDLKASFNLDFKEKFEYVKKVPLLLIDDIGAEVTTGWGRDEIFCPLIQYRMQEHLPTFFTSNLDLKTLEEHFSITKEKVDHIKARRIIERIIQLTDQIEMISKNLRG